MTNREILRPNNKRSIVLDRSDSGAIYNSDAEPSSTRSKDLDRSIGSNNPLIVTASVIPRFSRLSTWSFIKDCKGEITTVNPFSLRPLIKAGTWNVIDLPPPVGNTANSDLLSTAAFTACSWRFFPS
ncbi:hypothetical protein D3C80_1712250 [compost metagenome]